MILAPLTGGGEGGITRQMPVAVRGKAQVCSLLVAGIAGSNHTEGIYIRLLSLLCVVWVASSVTSWSPVQRSPNGYVCVCVCVWSRNFKMRRCVPYLNRNRVQTEFSALNDQAIHSVYSSLINTFMNSKAMNRTDLKYLRETQIFSHKIWS